MTILETIVATAIIAGSIAIAARTVSAERKQMRKTAAGFDSVSIESAIRHSLRSPLKQAYESTSPCLDASQLARDFAGKKISGLEFVAAEHAGSSKLTSAQKALLGSCSEGCLLVKKQERGDRQIAIVRLTTVALDYRTQREVECNNDLVEENQYASGVRYEIHPSFEGQDLAKVVGLLTHIALADQRAATNQNGQGTQYHVPAFWLSNQTDFPLPKVPADGDPLWQTSDVPFKQLSVPGYRGSPGAVYVVPKGCTATVPQILSTPPADLPACQPCFKNWMPGCQGR